MDNEPPPHPMYPSADPALSLAGSSAATDAWYSASPSVVPPTPDLVSDMSSVGTPVPVAERTGAWFFRTEDGAQIGSLALHLTANSILRPRETKLDSSLVKTGRHGRKTLQEKPFFTSSLKGSLHNTSDPHEDPLRPCYTRISYRIAAKSSDLSEVPEGPVVIRTSGLHAFLNSLSGSEQVKVFRPFVKHTVYAATATGDRMVFKAPDTVCSVEGLKGHVEWETENDRGQKTRLRTDDIEFTFSAKVEDASEVNLDPVPSLPAESQTRNQTG